MLLLGMGDCIFCKIITGEIRSWKVFENDKVYAFLDNYPASKYHTLVIPKKHSGNVFDMSEEDLLEVMKVVKKLVNLYKEKLGIENIQVINRSGKEAQQEVMHTHFHIVPRQRDDGQDMHWITHPEWTKEYDEMLLKIK